jgi:hypothetical protein
MVRNDMGFKVRPSFVHARPDRFGGEQNTRTGFKVHRHGFGGTRVTIQYSFFPLLSDS